MEWTDDCGERPGFAAVWRRGRGGGNWPKAETEDVYGCVWMCMDVDVCVLITAVTNGYVSCPRQCADSYWSVQMLHSAASVTFESSSPQFAAFAIRASAAVSSVGATE